MFRINKNPDETTDLVAKHPRGVEELLGELKKCRYPVAASPYGRGADRT